MPALDIRRYEPDDADAVWNLHETALREIGAFDAEYAHLDADLRAIPERYVRTGGTFLVGERGDGDATVVAMGGLQPATAVDHHVDDPAAGVVRRMRVDPDHQRQGYGTSILEALEARAPALAFDRLVLDTTPAQTAARGLYESFGYAETHREETPAGQMIFYAKAL